MGTAISIRYSPFVGSFIIRKNLVETKGKPLEEIEKEMMEK